jgi:hypothetical protein
MNQPEVKPGRKTVTTIEVCKMVAKKCHRQIYLTPPEPPKPKVVLLRKQTGEERRMLLWN